MKTPIIKDYQRRYADTDDTYYVAMLKEIARLKILQIPSKQYNKDMRWVINKFKVAIEWVERKLNITL